MTKTRKLYTFTEWHEFRVPADVSKALKANKFKPLWSDKLVIRKRV